MEVILTRLEATALAGGIFKMQNLQAAMTKTQNEQKEIAVEILLAHDLDPAKFQITNINDDTRVATVIPIPEAEQKGEIVDMPKPEEPVAVPEEPGGKSA
jgi:hypothetical protein